MPKIGSKNNQILKLRFEKFSKKTKKNSVKKQRTHSHKKILKHSFNFRLSFKNYPHAKNWFKKQPNFKIAWFGKKNQ